MHESRCRWVSFSFFLLASAKWLKDTLRPDPQFCTWNFPSSRRRRRDKSPRKGYALHTPSVKLTWTRGHFYFLHSLSLSLSLSLSHSLSPQSSQHMRVTDYLRSSVHRETVEEIILSFPPSLTPKHGRACLWKMVHSTPLSLSLKPEPLWRHEAPGPV